MTNEEWEQIRPAAEAFERAKTIFEVVGQQMIRHQDPCKAAEQDAAYERLRLHCLAAERDLEEAKRRVLG
jgi:hypothetical protein